MLKVISALSEWTG